MNMQNAPGIPMGETPSGFDPNIIRERNRILDIAVAEMRRQCEQLFVARDATHVDEDAIDGLHAVDLRFAIEGGAFPASVEFEIGYVVRGNGTFSAHNIAKEVICEEVREKVRTSIGA